LGHLVYAQSLRYIVLTLIPRPIRVLGPKTTHLKLIPMIPKFILPNFPLKLKEEEEGFKVLQVQITFPHHCLGLQDQGM